MKKLLALLLLLALPALQAQTPPPTPVVWQYTINWTPTAGKVWLIWLNAPSGTQPTQADASGGSAQVAVPIDGSTAYFLTIQVVPTTGPSAFAEFQFGPTTTPIMLVVPNSPTGLTIT